MEASFVGYLQGHNKYVTSIVCGRIEDESGEQREVLISGARDKKIIIWELYEESSEEKVGHPQIALSGHNHFVTDLCLSSNCNYLLSSSWDKSMRLWSLKTGKCTYKFFGSKKEITSCAMSLDSRQVFSSGFDNRLTLWNIKGELKAVSTEQNHKDCVSKIRFSPTSKYEYYASVGWDGRIKIWSKFFKLVASVKAHESPINALSLSKNGAQLATGSKNNEVKIWKIEAMEKAQIAYKTTSQVNDLAFNPEYKWIAAATHNSVYVWDISQEDRVDAIVEKKVEDDNKSDKYKFTSVCWSNDGQTLFAGCSDGLIRTFKVDFRSQ